LHTCLLLQVHDRVPPPPARRSIFFPFPSPAETNVPRSFTQSISGSAKLKNNGTARLAFIFPGPLAQPFLFSYFWNLFLTFPPTEACSPDGTLSICRGRPLNSAWENVFVLSGDSLFMWDKTLFPCVSRSYVPSRYLVSMPSPCGDHPLPPRAFFFSLERASPANCFLTQQVLVLLIFFCLVVTDPYCRPFHISRSGYFFLCALCFSDNTQLVWVFSCVRYSNNLLFSRLIRRIPIWSPHEGLSFLFVERLPYVNSSRRRFTRSVVYFWFITILFFSRAVRLSAVGEVL